MKTELGFRKLKESDVKQLAKVANNKNISRNMRDGFPHPYTVENAKTMVKRVNEDPHFKYAFAITLDDEVIGSVAGFFQDDVYAKNMEIGYWIAEEHWNKGFGTQAMKWITKYLFENTDVNRLFAGVFEYNVASANVCEKCGFRMVARVRQKVLKEGKEGCSAKVLTLSDEAGVEKYKLEGFGVSVIKGARDRRLDKEKLIGRLVKDGKYSMKAALALVEDCTTDKPK